MKGIVFLAVAQASLSAAQQTELDGKVRSGQKVVVRVGEDALLGVSQATIAHRAR